jgi:hypothetical protein
VVNCFFKVRKVDAKLTSIHPPCKGGGQVEIQQKQLYVQMVNIRQMLEYSLDGGTGEVLAKSKYMMKLLISLGSTLSCVGYTPVFLSLLLEMMAGLSPYPPWGISPSASISISLPLNTAKQVLLANHSSHSSFWSSFFSTNLVS